MRRLGLGLITVGLTLTSGCGGDGPKPSPFTPPPPSTASPNAATPVLPEAAKANTEAGAKAFVHYWAEVLNHALTTGDTSLLKTLSAPTCHTCAAVAKVLDSTYASGGYFQGGEWSLADMTTARDMTWPHGRVLSATVTVAPETTKSSSAAPVKRFAQKRIPWVFAVVRSQGVWQIADMTDQK